MKDNEVVNHNTKFIHIPEMPINVQLSFEPNKAHLIYSDNLQYVKVFLTSQIHASKGQFHSKIVNILALLKKLQACKSDL